MFRVREIHPEFYQPGFGQKIKVRGQGCNGNFQVLCNLFNIQTFSFLDQTQNLYTDRGTESLKMARPSETEQDFM